MKTFLVSPVSAIISISHPMMLVGTVIQLVCSAIVVLFKRLLRTSILASSAVLKLMSDTCMNTPFYMRVYAYRQRLRKHADGLTQGYGTGESRDSGIRGSCPAALLQTPRSRHGSLRSRHWFNSRIRARREQRLGDTGQERTESPRRRPVYIPSRSTDTGQERSETLEYGAGEPRLGGSCFQI